MVNGEWSMGVLRCGLAYWMFDAYNLKQPIKEKAETTEMSIHPSPLTIDP
jgi:hypothetical protein